MQNKLIHESVENNDLPRKTAKFARGAGLSGAGEASGAGGLALCFGGKNQIADFSKSHKNWRSRCGRLWQSPALGVWQKSPATGCSGNKKTVSSLGK